MNDHIDAPPDPRSTANSAVPGRATLSMALLRKLAVLSGAIAVFAACYWFFGDYLSLDRLAMHEAEFRTFQEQHPVLIYGIAFAAYVAVAGLSLPGAAAMTLVMGWLFGFWRGVLLVSFASTTGASVAFLLSRYLMRDALQHRFGGRLQKFNEALQKEGAFYLFTLRLIPAVPFFVINVVMGLTPLRLRTFWWVSQIGMLPGTAVYVFAGSRVPSLEELAKVGVGGILTTDVIVSFVLLGIFPIAIKRLIGWLRPSSAETTPSDSLDPIAEVPESSLQPDNTPGTDTKSRFNDSHARDEIRR